MIMVLAGHVDHGKTSLVKALTGIDTDRLPQEKQRGMTLDLGFAHLEFEGCAPIGIIDVPGHEHLIRNMLAGMSGLAAALLVVAADDGPMPQTMEHLQILDLLGITRGAVALTKTDVAPAGSADRLTAALHELLAPTTLREAPIFPVSCITGDGLGALSQWILDEASRDLPRADPLHFFRMPIDRAFTVPGSGTIVTGTVHNGDVRVGDRLMLSPLGHPVRVRGVQSHGAVLEDAHPGQRCALNLADAEIGEAGRGQWIVSGSAHCATTRFDSRIRVLATEGQALRHWTPVHLHHGTADVLARVAIDGEGKIAPGESSFVQIVTREPIHALHADRFILRDNSARRTLGGGMVLNPFAPRRRGSVDRIHAQRQVYERHSATGILTGLLESDDGGLDLPQFARALNLTPAGMTAALHGTRAVVLGRQASIGLSPGYAEALTMRALEAIRLFHHEHPQAPGIPLDSLRASAAPRLSRAAFQAFIRDLANRRHLVLSNDRLSLRDHDTTASAQDEALWQRVRPALQAAGAHCPLLAELAASLDVAEPLLRDFLHRKSRSGDVRHITANRFCLRTTLEDLAATAESVARDRPDGSFTAADFRDAIGTGRGLAIHYLEFFDQIGVTRRSGDQRRMAEHPMEPLRAGGTALAGIPPEHPHSSQVHP